MILDGVWAWLPLVMGILFGLLLGIHHILADSILEILQDNDPRKKKDAYYELFDDAENDE